MIVPDRHGSGTNALLLDPPTVITPAFGPGSFARHAALAAAAGRDGARRAAAVARARRRHARRPRGAAGRARRARRGGAARTRALLERLASVGLRLDALPGLPEVRPGDDLAALLAAAGARLDPPLGPADVLVVAHKVVSKAEGRVRALAEHRAVRRARSSSPPSTARTRATSRRSSTRRSSCVRADRGRLICRTRHGFVCANAGVDQSNTGAEDVVVLLPSIPTPRRERCAPRWASAPS